MISDALSPNNMLIKIQLSIVCCNLLAEPKRLVIFTELTIIDALSSTPQTDGSGAELPFEYQYRY